MKLLLDECVPRKFRNNLPSHECRSVHDEGWAGKKNGELLTLAEMSGFDVFVTLDRGIPYEQNLQSRKIAILLIHTKSNRLADLLAHVSDVSTALRSIQPGQLLKVG